MRENIYLPVRWRDHRWVEPIYANKRPGDIIYLGVIRQLFGSGRIWLRLTGWRRKHSFADISYIKA
ncbi:MAG: hypothetical protein IH950_08290 [Bacteroidetes bacterium]|nr:hypothetical protein [Bacteroidota bacterium]